MKGQPLQDDLMRWIDARGRGDTFTLGQLMLWGECSIASVQTALGAAVKQGLIEIEKEGAGSRPRIYKRNV